MTMQINGTSGLVFNDASTQNTATKYGMVNRIINGAMMIDQRNAGASVTPTGNPTYTLDRWLYALQQSSKMSIQQSTTAPTGFVNSLLATSLSAYTPLSSDYHAVSQRIEGLNMSDFAWGTANAVTVTLSFWVRSSLTGTFSGSIVNSAADRSYPFSFVINSANTFEYKTVTIAGDTSGTWLTTNGVGARLFFSLGTGSTYLGTAGAWANSFLVGATGSVQPTATNGATFYITGVQLEKGSTATSFDYRPYGTELQLCQRYCQRTSADANAIYCRFGNGMVSFGGTGNILYSLKTTMRTTPSVTSTGTASNYAIGTSGGTSNVCNAVPSVNTFGSNADTISMQMNTSASMTAGQACEFYSNNTSAAYLIFTAEL